MANKITNNLHWKNLTAEFPATEISVAGQKIVPLREAIKDGTIKAMIEECAAAMHNGNTLPVLTQMIQNCQSKQCVDNGKSGYRTTAMVQASAMNEELKAYLMELRAACPGQGNKRASFNGKAAWAITCEELDEITDVTKLKNVVACMASHKSKDLTERDELTAEDMQFLENYAYARKLYNAKKNEAATVTVGADLLAKLSKGSKATLSAAEAKELYEFLAAQQGK